MDVTRVRVAKNWEQQLVGHILQSHGDLIAGKKKGMGGATPSVNQMAEIEQVTIVGHTLKTDYGLQHTGLLQCTHETRIRNLLINPLFPTK